MVVMFSRKKNEKQKFKNDKCTVEKVENRIIFNSSDSMHTHKIWTP